MIDEINSNVNTYTETPIKGQVGFFSKMNTWLSEHGGVMISINTVITKLNIFIGQINTLASDIATSLETVLKAEAVALSAANYKSDWVANYQTTGYSLSDGVTYTDGQNYVSKIDSNLTEPTAGVDTAEWNFIDAVTKVELEARALLGGDAAQKFKVDDGVASDEAINVSQLAESIDSIKQIGSLLYSPFSTSRPQHILLIGQELLRADYQDLFNYAQVDLVVQATKDGDEKYKTAFGDGDGSTTFTVGDYRDAYFRAVGTLSEALGNWAPDEFKSHTHFANAVTYDTHGLNNYYGSGQFGARLGNIDATGGSETRPQAVSINVFMRY